MKGFLAFLALIALALSAYNMWEVHQLRQEVAALQVKLEEQRTSVSDQVVGQAARAIASAREAMANTNWDKARAILQTASDSLQQAARTASDRAAPTIKWLGQQATDLNKQVQDRMHGGH